MRWLLMLPVWLYQKLVGPWKPPTCRFDPTCSHYALGALRVWVQTRSRGMIFRAGCAAT